MKKKIDDLDSKPTQAEMVLEAWKHAENKDLFTVKIRKGDNFPLMSIWEAGPFAFTVVGVYANGMIQLARVMR